MRALPHVVDDVDGDRFGPRRRHHEDLRRDGLVPEAEHVRRHFPPGAGDRFGRNVGERLAGADGRAHGPLADRRAVVAHVALHHLLELATIIFGTPNGQASTQLEQAMQRGFSDRLHDAVLGLLDRVGGADLRAGRVVAVHADRRDRRDRVAAVEKVDVDHRDAAVRVALGAGVDAGLAADAARRIDVELVAEHQRAPEARQRAAGRHRLLAARRPRPTRRPGGLLEAAGRDLELGDLAARVERAVRQAVARCGRPASGTG